MSTREPRSEMENHRKLDRENKTQKAEREGGEEGERDSGKERVDK